MQKRRGTFKLLTLRMLWRILKMFLSSFSKIMEEILKKSGEYFVQIFKHSDGNL